MSIQGAVRYQCSCGAQYLVAINPGNDRIWLESVKAAAEAVEVELVDGSEPQFLCGSCGSVHARSETAVPVVADPLPAAGF